MVKKFSSSGLTFKALVIALLCMIVDGFGVAEGSPISAKQMMEARKKVNHLSRLAVTSIKSVDGDIIDCIDIYKQPAFDHPALKNHTIQMAPSYDPTAATMEGTTTTTRNTTKTRKKKGNLTMTVTSQIWQKSGSCPPGTIPFRRLKELLKANSVENYGRKNPSFFRQLNKQTLNFRRQNRSIAVLLTEGYSYSGIKGDIQVWNPFVESDDEYSTSRVSLKNGPYYDYENVEAGWAVNPSVYGDRQTRLFVYWTVDASNRTGCFDMTCPGFIQTSREVALGAAIYPLSVPSGLPYQITLYIFKDPLTGNWWVQYGEKINLGYWPSDLFTLLRGNAEVAEWGGEVYSSRLGHPHTKTCMGSGRYADSIFGYSGGIKRMRIRENSLVLKFPEWVSTYTDEYNCYSTLYVGDYVEDPEFYYGGPGGSSPICP